MGSQFLKKTLGGVGHGVLIGVANYHHIRKLPSVVINDVIQVNNILTDSQYCGYDAENIQILLDNDATLENIRASLDKIIFDSAEDDSVFIYFSGHGGTFKTPRIYSAILPVNFSKTNIEKSCFSDAEFSATLKRIKAKKILVILDACHSGGAIDFKDSDDELQYKFTDKSTDLISHGIGRVIIASSREDEVSMILNGDGNSTFTKHFLDAMKGNCKTDGDGIIRVFDLFHHVSNTVNSDVYKYTEGKHEQHPQFKADNLEDNFPIALDKGGQLNGEMKQEPTTSEKNNPDWKALVKILTNLYPMGPIDQDIWSRAGGDISRLKLSGNGKASWFSALDTLSKGGGGDNISFPTLLEEVKDDYPNNEELHKCIG